MQLAALILFVMETEKSQIIKHKYTSIWGYIVYTNIFTGVHMKYIIERKSRKTFLLLFRCC